MDGLIARALEALVRRTDAIDAVLPEDSPPVRVDAAQLETALVNLLENALKFSSQTDRVELHAEAAGDEVVVRIVDHGPGIPESERERIFEPFARGAKVRGGRAPVSGWRSRAASSTSTAAVSGSSASRAATTTFALALPTARAPVEAGR